MLGSVLRVAESTDADTQETQSAEAIMRPSQESLFSASRAKTLCNVSRRGTL